jgi:hypothetical protein
MGRLCRAGGDVVLECAEVVENLGDSGCSKGVPCGDAVKLEGEEMSDGSGEDLQPSISVCVQGEWGQEVAKGVREAQARKRRSTSSPMQYNYRKRQKQKVRKHNCKTISGLTRPKKICSLACSSLCTRRRCSSAYKRRLCVVLTPAAIPQHP